MYRFLLNRRWLGYAAAALALAAVMVLLGNWQWDRYQDRSARNARIEAGEQAVPVPLTEVLPRPGSDSNQVEPTSNREWAAVAVTGRYDSSREILARGRTVNGSVGFEVVTPLVLADGTAVLVNRGFLAAPLGDATVRPQVPPAASGQVNVTGRVRYSESGSRRVQRYEGRIEVRRISVDQLAGELPYPLFNAYLLLTAQIPTADPALVAVPVRTDNAWQSGTYAVQWWLFAVMLAAWYAWSVHREAHRSRPPAALADDGIPSASSGGRRAAGDLPLSGRR
ncbi:SURF1 family protein [Actinoplanes sp. ATCC 53533]|uniref:SURF1 family cytochrome oxidase biogenesis protein n=1 Tax=Actinoplanes sp. ATCC 53533 TaxID=1288362 RepID=UPI0013151ACA|nr:SURF1 family protein [Actinoplanes sp. ATCC 53533]